MGHYGKGGPSKVPLKKRKLRRSQVRRPQPTSRATYADLLTIGALRRGAARRPRRLAVRAVAAAA